MNLWSHVPNLKWAWCNEKLGRKHTHQEGRGMDAPPQVQPHPQGTSRELPVWNSCCFALQSPRRGAGEGRRKRNGFPSKPTHGPQKSSSHSGFGIWLFRAGCCMCQCPVTRRNGSESPTNHDLSNKDRCVYARTSCKHWTISIVSNSRFPHRDQSRLSSCIGAEITRTLRAVSHNKAFFFLLVYFCLFSVLSLFFFQVGH